MTALNPDLNTWKHVAKWSESTDFLKEDDEEEQIQSGKTPTADISSEAASQTDIQGHMRGLMDRLRLSPLTSGDAALNEVRAVREAKRLVTDAKLERRKAAAQQSGAKPGGEWESAVQRSPSICFAFFVIGIRLQISSA